jgi:hypothetical protein
MEDGVIFYLIDTEDDWNSWSEHLQETFATQTLQEWVCSSNFKAKASYGEIERETTLGRRLLEYQSEDQFWKDADYRRLKDLLEKVYQYWYSHRWAYVETTRNGRPRKAEYSQEVISKALKYANVPFLVKDGEEEVLYKNVTWSRSILGESNVQQWVKLVVIKENIFKYIYTRCGPEYFMNRTKDEVAEELHLPKVFANELCRWLVSTGNWKVVQARRNGCRRRELRFSIL